MITLKQAMEHLPLVAILRGIKPEEVIEYAAKLIEQGYRVIEVPLNSPSPYESIKLLSEAYGNDVVIGAGTVVTTEQVDLVAQAGGRIIISPHADSALIQYTKTKGLYSVPGFVTPTEAFAAIHAGADSLKLFPANVLGPEGLKAITTVLPQIDILPVGGVSPENMADYIAAGAKGFGLGSGLYKAGMSLEQMSQNGNNYIEVISNIS